MLGLLASIVIVTNVGFTVGYDTERLNPSWVSYDLEPTELRHMKRVPHSFKADDRIVQTRDVAGFYEAYGKYFDRGHLAPAADFNWNTNALDATYLFSNISPMTRKLNRGAWLDHENEVRQLAESGTVHVVMFPQYYDWYAPTGKILVPKSFVKVAWGWFGVRIWNEKNEE